MKGSMALWASVSSAALILAAPAQARMQAQASADPASARDQAGSQVTATATAASTDANAGDDIVVTGIRASLASAQAIKRNSGAIVDSIVAQDIGKLPDINVAEALQRITGVQISRSRGEGSGITIRGLTQIRTELDGRSIFSGGGRTLDLTSVPSELLAGADVFKSISADRIEGGIGGLVDLRLRKPFDFKGLEVAGQVRGTYYDLAGKARPAVSGLVSNRWETGIGDIGILVAGVYQKTAFRSDAVDGGGGKTVRGVLDLNNNGSRTDAADAILIQTTRGTAVSTGGRERIGFNGALQWHASPELLVHVDGAFNEFRNSDFTYANYPQANNVVDGNNLVVPGALGNDIQVYEGTNFFKSGTFNDAVDFPFVWGSESKSRVWQVAGGAQYDAGPVHLYADVSYTKVTSNGDFRQVALVADVDTLFFDLSQGYPSFSFTGADVTDARQVRINYAQAYPGRDDGSEFAWKVDGTFDIESSFLKSMKFGLRYADRKTAPSGLGGFFQLPNGATTPLANTTIPSTIVDYQANYSPNVLSGFGPGFSPQRYLTVNQDVLYGKDWAKVEALFGNQPYNPNGFNLSEETFAGYVMGNFDSNLGGIRLSGNAGVRVIRTDTSTVGTINQPDGSRSAISVASTYYSVLPMLNVKADITDSLVVRGALSKGLTRPDFGSLSPVLNLSYAYFTGSAGNPALKPIKSDQADLSVEYYFTPDSFAYVAGFLKNVDGFLTSVGTTERVPGQTREFIITRPVNGTTGKIRGYEIGWNQFLTFLPGVLSGFGFQANYTYVFSESPSPLAGSTESYPLLGLSKHSYNLVGIYEKGPLSLRVAYNWRDKSFNSLISGSDIAPDFAGAIGYLDASASVDVTSKITIFGEANNLTRAVATTYYEDPRRPHFAGYDDRRFSAGVRFRF